MGEVIGPEVIETKNIRIDICPFCKQPAKLFRNRLWWKEYGYEGKYIYHVGCDNRNCPVQPRTKTYDDTYVDTDIAITDAISDWNWTNGKE